MFRILFKDFLTFVFRQIFLLKKKTKILAPQTRLNDFSPNNLVPRERERVGREGENPGNEVCSSKSLEILKFFNLSLHLSFTYCRAHFFLSLSPYKDLYGDHLTVTQGGKSRFSCTSPFYFRWALQESCNRYFRDISLKIYRIFTVLYALIVPAKIIFFNNIIVIVFTESHQVTMIYCKRPIRFP